MAERADHALEEPQVRALALGRQEPRDAAHERYRPAQPRAGTGRPRAVAASAPNPIAVHAISSTRRVSMKDRPAGAPRPRAAKAAICPPSSTPRPAGTQKVAKRSAVAKVSTMSAVAKV